MLISILGISLFAGILAFVFSLLVAWVAAGPVPAATAGTADVTQRLGLRRWLRWRAGWSGALAGAASAVGVAASAAAARLEAGDRHELDTTFPPPVFDTAQTCPRFPGQALEAIERAVTESELAHSGEIRVAIEAALEPQEIWAGKTPRERALQVFAALGVWDTEANNGILIYVQLADRDVEIVATVVSMVASAPRSGLRSATRWK